MIKYNVVNLVMKLLNSVMWAILAKILLTVVYEIAKHQSELPELSYGTYINQVVVLVFLICLSTYRITKEDFFFKIEQPPYDAPSPQQTTETMDDELEALKAQLK